MPHGILYCLNLNLAVFQSRSRSHVSLSRSYVTAVNSSFQPLPIFCHKELHLRCCIGLKLNINMIHENCKKWWGIFPPPMIECNLGKIWKTHSRICLKTTFPDFFHIKFFAFNISGPSGVNINLLMKIVALL